MLRVASRWVAIAAPCAAARRSSSASSTRKATWLGCWSGSTKAKRAPPDSTSAQVGSWWMTVVPGHRAPLPLDGLGDVGDLLGDVIELHRLLLLRPRTG